MIAAKRPETNLAPSRATVRVFRRCCGARLAQVGTVGHSVGTSAFKASAKVRPEMAQSWPNGALNHPISTKRGSNSANVGPISPPDLLRTNVQTRDQELARHRTNLARHRPNLARSRPKLAPHRSKVGPTRSRDQPQLTNNSHGDGQHRPDVERIWPEFGQIWAPRRGGPMIIFGRGLSTIVHVWPVAHLSKGA